MQTFKLVTLKPEMLEEHLQRGSYHRPGSPQVMGRSEETSPQQQDPIRPGGRILPLCPPGPQ